MKETSAGNVKIAYEDLGSAEPALLLMPAWCMSHHGFDKLPQMLSAKASRSRAWIGADTARRKRPKKILAGRRFWKMLWPLSKIVACSK